MIKLLIIISDNTYYFGSEAFTVVPVMTFMFSDITLDSAVKVKRHFGGSYPLHLQR
jgi:hypothetical protein